MIKSAINATLLADGTVVYDGTNGSANAVIPTESGVQMVIAIANSEAPTRYDYKVDVPSGGHIEILEDGAVILDGSGALVTAVQAPWAKDANGAIVPTHFETDGRTLTQVVGHTNNSYAYPIIADPFWIPAWVMWACGIGFLSGGASYYVGGGNSLWRFLASGGVGCVFGIIGKKF